MSCCDKIGSGPYAGNYPGAFQELQKAARTVAGNENAKVVIENGIPYATTDLSFSHKMPIPALVAGALGAVRSIQSGTVARAESGQTVTAPKTVAGKLLGAITGRNKAAAISNANLNQDQMSNLKRQGVPISGGLQFGAAEQNQNLKILGLVAVTVLGIFYFNRNKKGRRRR
jgi:hypothetical protein